MIAMWIAIFVIIQALVLIFAFTLCKSAALADREYERAHLADRSTRLHSPNRVDSQTGSRLSPDTNPASRLGYSRTDS